MHLRASFIFTAALLCAIFSKAQNFGGFPPSLQWQQINSDTARILFAPAAQAEAIRIAQLVHKMAADTPFAIGSKLKKIPIVLHSNTTQANGYVALGPFRSEYYLIPGGDIFEFGNLPWHENLAVHEYRHVQQYNNFNNGLTKLFSVLGGQNGRALANALTIPDWFFEGDAVYAETAFTNMGRGRQPLFLSAYNSLWQEGKDYSWMKLRNGSLKDFVPNHYPLGYLLVNYGYLKNGLHFWRNVTHDASGFKGLFYPMQKAVQRYSHEDFKTFRNEAFAYYKTQVPEQPAVTTDKVVTNYYFPQAMGEDSLVYLKDSYRSLPAFYIRDRRGEHRVMLRNISTENWFRYAAGKVVYTAYTANPRWNLVDYSDIYIADLHTGMEKKLTKRGKYYTPDLSPDGTCMVAVSINDSLQTELHVFGSDGYGLLKKFVAPQDGYFVHPKFIDSAHIVVGVRTNEGLLSLQLLNLETGTYETVIQPQRSTIGNPSVHDNVLYFTASFAGNDDLYAYRFAERKVYQLTALKTGSYYPAVYNHSLVWSQFTTKGLQLQQQPLRSLLWREVDLLPKVETPAFFKVASAAINVLDSPSIRDFAIKKYSKAAGLINVHSWDPGLNLYSTNILNTLSATAYYNYNSTERAHTTGVTAAYGGFFPVISAYVENTFNRHIQTGTQTIYANETEAGAGFNIPLNFTTGKTLKGFNVGSSVVVNAFQPIGTSKNFYDRSQSLYLHHFASWSQQLQRARQQIYPRLGYSVALHYRDRLDAKGFQYSGGTTLYLPTFSNTHALVLTGTFQQTDTGNVFFSNRFSLARGYSDVYYSGMWNVGANYHFPVAYPDWGFANLVYFLRLRANVYFDYSQVHSNRTGTTAALRSTGTEIYFDTKWWNELPVSFGVRYSYLLDKAFAGTNRHVIEFIVPVDLIPF